jgi:membrane protease YdiL (CAAX protease family)
MRESPPAKGRPSSVFAVALLIGWIVLGAAGVGYARFKGIPNWAALPLLAAFLAEYPFYLVLAFPTLRERFAGVNLPASLVGLSVLPYLLCCMGASQFHWMGLLRVAALALTMGLWYRVLPKHAIVDVAFLALYPAVLLGGYFDAIYIPLFSGLRHEVIFLGHFTLIVMTILTLMIGRRVPETGFGFFPTKREWGIGAAHYLYFVVAGLPLALALHALQWKRPAPVWSIAATFVGFLWVASLSEEFLVRGVLQQWMEKWMSSRAAALILTSIVFGLLHLGYGHYPNWRWVAVATVLGLCCGHARNQAGGIRAGVVTHALAVATWRAFLT